MSRTGAFAAALSAVAGLSAAAGLHKLTHQFPTVNGRLRVGGLRAPVEIVRDRWGVPFISAQTDADLFFAQGFVHAQDRYLQMELQRRAGSGTLAEVVGEKGLASDRFMRRLGLMRVAQNESQRLDEESETLADAYARGVNAFLDLEPLPWELKLVTRQDVKRWAIVDCLAFGRIMAWSLSENLGAEMTRAQIVRLVGPDALADIDSTYAEGHPVAVPPGEAATLSNQDFLSQLREAHRWLGGASLGASNGWAVDGNRTSSGRPLLANDPHLMMQIPSVWYEMGLQSPGFHVVGATLPGLPGVMIGHNERIAWGITAGMVDTTDAFVERIDAEGKQYQTPQGWRNLMFLEESIEVKGRKAPHVEQVAFTRHGPLVTERDANGYATSIQSTTLRSESSATGLFRLNRANNWNEFREALHHWAAPCLNFIYSDVEGNVGYQLAGSVPKRKPGTGILPGAGWSETSDWEGFLDFEQLPYSLNPAGGAVASANNRTNPPESDPNIHGEWIDGFRAQRIWDMLGQANAFTVQDFQRMQGDVYSIPGSEMRSLIMNLDPTDGTERLALAFLREWDGYLTERTVGGTVYEALFLHLTRRIVGLRLGQAADLYFGSGSVGMLSASALTYRWTSKLLEILGQPAPVWTNLPDQNWEPLLAECFTQAITDLKAKLGNDVLKWQWGRLHKLTLRHLMGALPGLDKVLNKGPYSMPGDGNTVLQSASSYRHPYQVSGWTVSYRQVIDVGNWENCWSILTPGQSGHRFAKHYSDAVSPWRKIEYHPMVFERDTAIEHAESALRLEPPY